MIQLNDFKRMAAQYGDELVAAAGRVISSGWYVLGEEVVRFEAQFAEFQNVPFCIGMANGLDAIQMGLRALGIGPGDEVVTTPFSAFATTLAILNVGATPIFVDVDAATLNLDPSQLDAVYTERTRAVVAVHLYGNPCDVGSIAAFCARRGVHFIEDAAQAHGALYRGKSVGTFGVLGCFSFYPTKNLGAIGDGGAAVCSDPKLAASLRALRDYGQSQKYLHDQLGMNSRLDELQAALLSVRIRVLASETARRQAIAERYVTEMRNESISVVATTADAVSCRHLFPVRTTDRERLMQHLRQRGVQSAVHYPIPLHRQPAYQQSAVARAFDLPRVDAAAREVLSLPIHPFLTDDEVATVIAAVNDYGT